MSSAHAISPALNPSETTASSISDPHEVRAGNRNDPLYRRKLVDSRQEFIARRVAAHIGCDVRTVRMCFLGAPISPTSHYAIRCALAELGESAPVPVDR